ncbi:MAG TPA: YtxH domain-containing protein [Thermomicrobiales bacterium]|nr:YtxH domain-containing protein [Thermomicrobiales bacterium]
MALTRSDENRHDFAFIAGAIIGAIAGALVTLALTPMSGADTREKLKSRAGELGPLKERAMEAAAPVKDKAGSLATTAAEKGKTLAATGKERAADLAAKAPIGRGSHDDTQVSPNEAGAMIFGSEPGAHPGGIVTPGALADAGADVAGTTERPPRIQPIEVADPVIDAHAQDPAEGARDAATDSGNGRVSEKPVS